MFSKIGRVIVRHPWWTIGARVVVATAVIALAPGPSGRQAATAAPDGAPAHPALDPEPATPQSVGEGR